MKSFVHFGSKGFYSSNNQLQLLFQTLLILDFQYQRLVVRRGGKNATIAVGHTLLVIIYHLLSEDKDYLEPGGKYFDEWDRQAVQKRLVHRLEKLGYQVKLEPTSPAA